MGQIDPLLYRFFPFFFQSVLALPTKCSISVHLYGSFTAFENEKNFRKKKTFFTFMQRTLMPR